MRIPAIRGIIERRLLINFRVDPAVLARVCPSPFRPQIVSGFGVAGICLIRLKHVRPAWLPGFVGISSENAAHRIAVEWDTPDGTQTGVYIPRRDTSSLLNAFAGGRFFPGLHHRARFDVSEADGQYSIAMHSRDGSGQVTVDGQVDGRFPADSVFSTVADCSEFFESGSVGYSPATMPGRFDGLELRTHNWSVRPMTVSRVQSSFFENRDAFPEGSVTLDNALVMRNIDHEWHSREPLCCMR